MVKRNLRRTQDCGKLYAAMAHPAHAADSYVPVVSVKTTDTSACTAQAKQSISSRRS